MILVMTDRLTNYAKFEPTHSTATAQDIADLVYRSWYRQFGLPKVITSDRDKLFTSKFWKELHKRIHIHFLHTALLSIGEVWLTKFIIGNVGKDTVDAGDKSPPCFLIQTVPKNVPNFCFYYSNLGIYNV